MFAQTRCECIPQARSQHPSADGLAKHACLLPSQRSTIRNIYLASPAKGRLPMSTLTPLSQSKKAYREVQVD